MNTSDFILGPLPTSERRRELWIQHAVGFILFEDVRGLAIQRLDPNLDATARVAALKAIDDTVSGLMMVIAVRRGRCHSLRSPPSKKSPLGKGIFNI